MKLSDMLDLCQAYSDLGWAVQEQLRRVVNDPDCKDDQSADALALAEQRFLAPLSKAAHWSDLPELEGEVDQLLDLLSN
jgi:hypothetical protein